MSKFWKVFSGEYLFNLNGAPIGSYEETSALFGCSGVRQRSSGRRKEKHDPTTGVRRSKRRLVSGMGSNVSRHSGKGLSGRRAQSSGSLCKILAPRVGRVLNPCGEGVRRRDRNRLSGSLPNRLDDKEMGSRGSTPETIYGDLYARPGTVDLFLHKLGPQGDPGGGDQGYDSERSPDDDLGPKKFADAKHRRCSVVQRSTEMSFITKDNTFEARLEKGSRGLGLSVTGGVDSGDQYPGLIRIKRIFPHQPAWECGALDNGDIILEANGTPLTGLTNHEALEVLRTTPSEVVLKVCRPPGEIFPVLLPSGGEPPPPPKRDPVRHIPLSSQSSSSSNMLPLPLVSAEPYGEFEVLLKKVNGSLGFTLRKEDESVLGHYVRALVREPAISDGRIRPGDKIVSVNGADISPMSHEEAVAFLRQTGEEVKLRMYRDPAQTPVSALSPTDSHKTFRPKPALRKEAMDMLCDLAVKKFTPSETTGSSRTRLRSTSPGSSPRRRRLTRAPADEGGDPSVGPREGGGPSGGLREGGGPSGGLREGGGLSGGLREGGGPSGGLREGGGLSGGLREGGGPSGGPREGGGLSGGLREGGDTLRRHKFRPREDIYAPPSEPASMPPLPTSEFSHKNPVYQSAHPAVHSEGDSGGQERLSDQNIPDAVFRERGGSQGLLKWKGVVFTPEDDDDDVMDKKNPSLKDQVLTVELCRGWNSRLGFSLQSSDSATLISAIYPDSVAAKDGRLQSGDEVIMINDESTRHMKTSEVIDLLRRVRGTIAITVVRSS